MIIHPWKDYANKTLNWLPMDTQERYNQNLKENFDLLHRFGWIDQQIEYKFNSHGFRTKEFMDLPSAVFLGCSHTAGVGLPVENTWPYYVSNNINLHCYNLAIGGGSNDLAFRISYYYLEKLKPKIVFLLSPEPARIEILTPNDVLSIIPNDKDQQVGYYYKLFLSNDKNFILNQQKNILGIESLCNRLKIKFVYIDEPYAIETNSLDLARDLMHKGPESNFNLAQRFLNML